MSPKDDILRHQPSSVTNREERLEAELRANLRRRKEQARARSRAGVCVPEAGEKAGNSKPSGENNGG
ncbi:MAG: hypothetical protein V3S34_05315 [Hyphomicrobium sp.]